MFRILFSPLLRKSKPPVQVQDTIITAWTIRHPTRNRNDPIARAELYQLSYIPPRPSGACMKESDCFFYSFPWRSWAILDLNSETIAREVNHRTYGPTNWERINRFLFGSDSSFPNASIQLSVVLRSPKCACSPFFPYHGKSL
ncbi:Malic enzyme [Quillaja saponaria]|uniref:Malic enzyme n=1 Tax=Quillaja saponaria TaxID=32244 RepID=A0AAD7KKU9_QUISA|nr:Malic enzyme [Quillaja saponaria]